MRRVRPGGSRGACPPPPEPPASGRVPVPETGRLSGRTRRRVRARGSESRGNTNGSSRFFAERPLRISAPLRRVPSQCGFARDCRTPEYVEAPTVRGETRHCVPLSLPRTPLLPAFCCAADCRQVLYCLSISDGLWEQRRQRRERNSRNGTAFSRAQARSAPRAEFP